MSQNAFYDFWPISNLRSYANKALFQMHSILTTYFNATYDGRRVNGHALFGEEGAFEEEEEIEMRFYKFLIPSLCSFFYKRRVSKSCLTSLELI